MARDWGAAFKLVPSDSPINAAVHTPGMKLRVRRASPLLQLHSLKLVARAVGYTRTSMMQALVASAPRKNSHCRKSTEFLAKSCAGNRQCSCACLARGPGPRHPSPTADGVRRNSHAKTDQRAAFVSSARQHSTACLLWANLYKDFINKTCPRISVGNPILTEFHQSWPVQPKDHLWAG